MMRKSNPLPSARRLSRIFEYDPASGALLWRISRGRVKPGVIAGEVAARGYRVVRLDGVRYAAHRVIYRMVYGIDPGCREIDHINGDPSDNRISNLRIASHSQNMQNGRIRVNNTSGRRGVVWRSDVRKYQAQIVKDGRNIYLGLFPSLDKASAAYETAAKKLHGDYVRQTHIEGKRHE